MAKRKMVDHGENLKALDLFCGAGGASMGLHQAGYQVIGIDVKPQKNYPFTFIRGDALSPPVDISEFDLIWASPPCQAYSLSRNNGCHKNAPDLLPETRALLKATGKPWIIENVIGAPMPSGIMLCGASFGLGASGFDLPRHRLFEASFPFLAPPCQHVIGKTFGVYGHGTNSWHRNILGRNISKSECEEAMEIDWMTRIELTQAVPPAYGKFMGQAARNA